MKLFGFLRFHMKLFAFSRFHTKFTHEIVSFFSVSHEIVLGLFFIPKNTVTRTYFGLFLGNEIVKCTLFCHHFPETCLTYAARWEGQGSGAMGGGRCKGGEHPAECACRHTPRVWLSVQSGAIVFVYFPRFFKKKLNNFPPFYFPCLRLQPGCNPEIAAPRPPPAAQAHEQGV